MLKVIKLIACICCLLSAWISEFTFAQPNEEPGTSNIMLLAYIHLQQQKLTSPEPTPEPTQQSAQEIYASNLEQQVVQAKCVACHVDGGVAASAKLLFNKGANYSQDNFNALEAFLALQNVDADYILSKVRGIGHGGGTQLLSTSDDYKNLASLLSVMSECTSCSSATVDGYEGIIMMTDRQILRKANLLLNGRFPTEEEYLSFEAADTSQKKKQLVDSFKGQQFHEYIKYAANEKLLFRGLFLGGAQFALFDGDANIPEYWNFKVHGGRVSEQRRWDVFGAHWYAGAEEPLELIAHVVNNDLPFSEILTADYTMVNPYTNITYRSGVDFEFNPLENIETFKVGQGWLDFKVGRNKGILKDTSNIEYEVESIDGGSIEGLILNPNSDYLDYPHAGILNSFAFLDRYPTTETNRNRARSRWVNYHFLGLDIEASAPRSQKQEDLTDTNNPTLNNPACNVCHKVMDPVAGAFQNYASDKSFYRISGTDGLPWHYKEPPDGSPTLYQQGDLWFRDMLAPGFNGEELTDNDKSVQWLAQKIVKDTRFKKASVEFWWPALTNFKVLKAPEVQSDADYKERLAAYDLQQSAIAAFAEQFAQSNMNVKHLFADIIMSPWFAAEELNSSEDKSIQYQHLGRGQLLNPKQLSMKVKALFSHAWNESPLHYFTENGDLEVKTDAFSMYGYGPFIGEIDYYTSIERPRFPTVTTYNVLVRQAVELSSYEVLVDLLKGDSERKFFGGITMNDLPSDPKAKSKILEKIVQLHFLFWGDVVDINDAEVQRSFSLLLKLYSAMKDANKNYIYEIDTIQNPDTGELVSVTDLCVTCNIKEDPTFMKGAWAGLFKYFMTHYKFIYE